MTARHSSGGGGGGGAGSVVLVTAGYDYTVRFWEAPTAVCVRTLQYPDSQVNRLCVTRDKQSLAVAGNPHVRIFEVGGKSPNPLASFEAHKTNVTALGFQVDARWMYTASEDATIKVWDTRVHSGGAMGAGATATATAPQRDYRAAAPVYAAQLHPNQSEIVAGDQEGRVCVWDVRGSSAAPVKEVQIEPENAVRALSVSPDGRRLAVASNRGRVVVYALAGKDTGQLAQVAAFQAHPAGILQATFSPDSALLATASADHTVKLWRAAEDEYSLDKTLSGHQRWVWDCAFNSDASYIITGSSDHVARLWSVASGETIRHYAGHHKAISCVALSDAV